MCREINFGQTPNHDKGENQEQWQHDTSWLSLLLQEMQRDMIHTFTYDTLRCFTFCHARHTHTQQDYENLWDYVVTVPVHLLHHPRRHLQRTCSWHWCHCLESLWWSLVHVASKESTQSEAHTVVRCKFTADIEHLVLAPTCGYPCGSPNQPIPTLTSFVGLIQVNTATTLPMTIRAPKVALLAPYMHPISGRKIGSCGMKVESESGKKRKDTILRAQQTSLNRFNRDDCIILK